MIYLVQYSAASHNACDAPAFRYCLYIFVDQMIDDPLMEWPTCYVLPSFISQRFPLNVSDFDCKELSFRLIVNYALV